MVAAHRLTRPTRPTVRTLGAKRGEVLAFRPRKVFSAGPLAPPPSLRPAPVSQPGAIITCGGREFVATAAMADCFLAWVHRVIDAGETALVPLLHAGGIDLLLISATTPLGIRPQESP